MPLTSCSAHFLVKTVLLMYLWSELIFDRLRLLSRFSWLMLCCALLYTLPHPPVGSAAPHDIGSRSNHLTEYIPPVPLPHPTYSHRTHARYGRSIVYTTSFCNPLGYKPTFTTRYE
ncbi:hypothetical protein C8Q77DRAFT_559965 [Trametes polyzona]|nr:hypothetical protein C8Q77DRAFT_559965 [Trametes polyzona]